MTEGRSTASHGSGRGSEPPAHLSRHVSLVGVPDCEGDVRNWIVCENGSAPGKASPVQPNPELRRAAGGRRDPSPECAFAHPQSRDTPGGAVQRGEEVVDNGVPPLEPSLGCVDHVLGCSIRVLGNRAEPRGGKRAAASQVHSPARGSFYLRFPSRHGPGRQSHADENGTRQRVHPVWLRVQPGQDRRCLPGRGQTCDEIAASIGPHLDGFPVRTGGPGSDVSPSSCVRVCQAIHPVLPTPLCAGAHNGPRISCERLHQPRTPAPDHASAPST